MRIFTGNVDVKLPTKVAGEIERATRKKSPSKLGYQIVFVGYPFNLLGHSALIDVHFRLIKMGTTPV